LIARNSLCLRKRFFEGLRNGHRKILNTL
jgi:hypothetical protein